MNRFKRRLPIALLFLSGLPLLGRADPAPADAPAAADPAPAAATVAQADTTVTAQADASAAPAPTVTAQADSGAAAPVAAAAGASTALSTVSVIGQRETRQVQRLNRQQILDQPAGTSPLKMLENLPGVHFASDDPFGNDEWSSRINIRGFDHTRLGYTLDGIPLGNDDYHTGDGLSPIRAWVGENLKEIELAEGAGALHTASSSNLGGTVELATDDPDNKAGVHADQTVGSHAFKRSYLRGDSGNLDGFKAYVSGLFVDEPKWKGNDSQLQRQLNFKATYDWSGGKISGIYDYAHRVEQAYLDLSQQTLSRCGYDFDYLAPNWQEALAVSQLPTDGSGSVGCIHSPDDTYFNGNGLRHDNLASLKGEFFLADALTLNAQVYYHHDLGQGHWYAPAEDLPGGQVPSGDAPIALRLSHYLMEREGTIDSLVYDTGMNRVEGGYWFERSDYTIARSFNFIAGGFNSEPIGQNVIYDDYTDTLFGQRFVTLTGQWFLQDTLYLLHKDLRIDVGFKGHTISTGATSQTAGLGVLPDTPPANQPAPPTPRAGGTLTTKDYFLPQLGVNYRIGGGYETFAGVSTAQAAFEPGANGAWSTDQATFNSLQGTLRPERSTTYELGARYSGPTLQSSIALYDVDFRNRLLVIVPCNGATSCPNQIANVGHVGTKGVEANLLWQPIKPLQWNNSFTFNDSKYKNDYTDYSYSASGDVPTKGKRVVDSPRELFASDLSYKYNAGFWGTFGGTLGGKYTGARYYTYVNDNKIGGFWLMDAGLSWDRRDVGFLKDLKASLTVSNLLDKKYIATIDSNGFTTSDPTGSFATLLVGSPTQVYFTLDGRF